MKRYTYNGDLTATDTGELVLASDADAEIAALRERAKDNLECYQAERALFQSMKECADLFKSERDAALARVAELDSQLDKLHDKYTDLDAENAGLCVLRDQLQARVAELERTIPAPARAVVEAAEHSHGTCARRPCMTCDALAAFREWEKGADDGRERREGPEHGK